MQSFKQPTKEKIKLYTKTKPLIILGVDHTTDSPSYQTTLEWIRENVEPGMKVGLEGIEPDGSVRHSSDPQSEAYVRGVKSEIESKRAEVVPIETRGVIKRQSDIFHLKELETEEFHKTMLEEIVPTVREMKERGITVNDDDSVTSSNEEEGRLLQKLDDDYSELERLGGSIIEMGVKEVIFGALKAKHMLQNSLNDGVDVSIMGMSNAEAIGYFADHLRDRISIINLAGEQHDEDIKMIKSREGLEDRIKRRFNRVKLPETDSTET